MPPNLSCPSCGSTSPFQVSPRVTHQVYRSDPEDQEQEFRVIDAPSWTPDCPTECYECNHSGPLSEFTVP